MHNQSKALLYDRKALGRGLRSLFFRMFEKQGELFPPDSIECKQFVDLIMRILVAGALHNQLIHPFHILAPLGARVPNQP